MSWWAWVLIAWVILAASAALFLGAAVPIIRHREREARAAQHERTPEQEPRTTDRATPGAVLDVAADTRAALTRRTRFRVAEFRE